MELSKFTNLNFLTESYIHAATPHKIAAKMKSNKRKLCEKESTCPLCNKTFVENELSKRFFVDHMGHRLQLCEQCEMPYETKLSIVNSDVDQGNKTVLSETCTASIRQEDNVENDHVAPNEREIPLNNECIQQFTEENVPKGNFLKSIGLKRKLCNENFSSSSCVKKQPPVSDVCNRQLRKRKACYKTFVTENHDKNHICPSTSKEHCKCEICNKTCNSKQSIAHEIENLGVSSSKCVKKHCSLKEKDNLLEVGTMVITQEQIADHEVLSTHDLEPPVSDVCNRQLRKSKACHKTFVTENHVKNPLSPSTSKEHCKCEICNKTIHSKQSITRKIKNLQVSSSNSVKNHCFLKEKDNLSEVGTMIITQEHIADHEVLSTHYLEPPVSDVCNRQLRKNKACHKTFVTENHVKKHICPSTSKEDCKCEICCITFNLKQSIPRKIEKLHVCQICNKQFSRLWLLKNHVIVHSWDEQFPSEICNKKIIKKHNLNKSYSCRICHKQFLYWLHLEQHLRCAHDADKTNKCAFCSSGIYTKNELKQHTCKNSYSCHLCNKQFTRKEGLDSHNLVHVGEKPYKCEVCRKLFNRKNNFDRHLLIHPQPNKTNISNETHIPEKINKTCYVCPTCNQKFAQKSLCRRHILGHKKKYQKNSSP